MHVTIFRRRFTPWSVDGTLTINGVFFTGTVEHPKRYIPAGSYKIVPIPVRIDKKKEIIKTMPTILEKKARVPNYPVLCKPYLKPGYGPLTSNFGSIVMGKSLKTGLVAYDEELFQLFCDMISDALKRKEKITLVIKNLGKDNIPNEDMFNLPQDIPAINLPANTILAFDVPVKKILK